MISLVEFLRKRLCLGSQEPPLEEEAEWYIKQLQEHMALKAHSSVKGPLYYREQGWKDAVNEMLNSLRGTKP
jgi:uncharacterized protein (DUF2164 family)